MSVSEATFLVDILEGLKDSPTFREQLGRAEGRTDAFEEKLSNVYKLCANMIDAGQIYVEAHNVFNGSLKEVSRDIDDDGVSATVDHLINCFDHLTSYHKLLLEETRRTIGRLLDNLVRRDMVSLRLKRHDFQRSLQSLETKTDKCCQVARSKQVEYKEAADQVQHARSAYNTTAIDYIKQLNSAEIARKSHLLACVLRYAEAQTRCYHDAEKLAQSLQPNISRAHDLLKRLEKQADDNGRELEYITEEYMQLKNLESGVEACMKEMEQSTDGYIQAVRQRVANGETSHLQLQLSQQTDVAQPRTLEGWLLRKTSHKNIKKWVRRFTQLSGTQISYRRRDPQQDVVLVSNLGLCKVRALPELDRRFCFEIQMPDRFHLLQAESEVECRLWVQALTEAIEWAITTGQDVTPTQTTPSSVSGKESKDRVNQLIEMAGNDRCADCNAMLSIDTNVRDHGYSSAWASINLGIVICLECSGVHRTFGVHISKVRSVTLDEWDTEVVKIMFRLGNLSVNSFYEKRLPPGEKPRHDSDRQVRIDFLKRKYIEKRYIERVTTEEQKQALNRSLYTGAEKGDLVGILQAITQGGDVNAPNQDTDGMTPLMAAASLDRIFTTEFLLLNNAKVNGVVDGQVLMLLKRKADVGVRDAAGKDAEQVALESEHGDIVSMIRVYKLNCEERDEQLGAAGVPSKKSHH